ncbi:efflux RND transporter periplasmic adaptor subunit [Acinetobacter bereziniae]|jgi:multidrug efflux system membrane fusion protein|uniref:efflux RND transporter periplasmic adaptor subunit n=1 Tax=Acinetobacter TaxID=469 RepID=UPI0006294A23|nr:MULTISPECIES: efflux RND transporter periplasmic adaptor subunit [Acinetobacter]KKW79338.1 multidrug transporter [Acinetobacter sp. Ag2]MBJ9949652.1 efflux RND transporter periplasmic adaptor subunit [Acinetobacter bereziniae]MDQ9817574.1 efflux RND transporter periplasmic adaptor subunit [Acinetobacter bereziniae]MDR0236094.1 efflux RND transporter periplasmic adaptor subunit [Acinetobacter sp.]TNL52226.1 efflux RND transporter periplasmic adaptor subunit [Acinetobacter bereziniae]
MSNPLVNISPKKSSLQQKFKYLIGLIILIGLALAGFYWKKSTSKPVEEYSQWSKPVPVRTVSVQQQNLQLEIKAIGTVIPAHTVNVQSQVSGVLQQIYFKEGQWVKKGELLAQLDPAPFQVALAQAQGTQQQNLAQLQNAETELKRYQLLFKQDSIAKQQVEQQQALVNQLKGQIQSNKAQVDAAKLQLSYTRIYSPIAGRVGFRQKDAGNLIQANETTGLVTITQVHPIYVQFAVAENYLMGLRDTLKKGQQIEVSAWDKSEQNKLAMGHVQSLDNQIDVSTGTLKLKAVFNNQDDALFPNQFVNVRLNTQTIQNAITIPNDAVQHGAKGTYVYIVNPQHKAEIRMLKLGMTSNGQIEVIEGLTAKEQVVLEGIDRLSEGKEVQIVSDQRQQTSNVDATQR